MFSKYFKSAVVLVALVFVLVCASLSVNAGVSTSITGAISSTISYGITQIEAFVAYWVFDLEENDSTTVTNPTALVWYNDTNLYGDELVGDGSFTVTADGTNKVAVTIDVAAQDTNTYYALSYQITSNTLVGGSGTFRVGGFDSADVFSPAITLDDSVGTFIVSGKSKSSGTLTKFNFWVTSTYTSGTLSGEITSIRKVNSPSLVTLPDDTPIQNGMHYADTVAGGARLGGDLFSTITYAESPPNSTGVTDSEDERVTTLTTDGTLVQAILANVTSVGKRVKLTYTVLEHSGGFFTTVDVGGSALETAPGSYTMEYDTLSPSLIIKRGVGVSSSIKFRIDAFEEVLPTYSFTTPDGTKIAKTEILQTANGAVESLVAINSWAADTDLVEDNQLVVLDTTEGIPVWGTYDSDRLGSDVWCASPTTGTGWTDNGDGTYTSDGTGGTAIGLTCISGEAGTTFAFNVEVVSYTSGDFTVRAGTEYHGTYFEDSVPYVPEVTAAGNSGLYIYARSFVGTIRINSVKPVKRSDSTQPTVSITDIGGSAITDNTAEFTVGGVHTAEGLFSGLAATNTLLDSNDFSQTSWSVTGTASKNGTNAVNLPAEQDSIRQSSTAYSSGDDIVFSVELSGSGTTSLAFFGTALGLQFSPSITLTNTPTLYYFTITMAATESVSAYVRRNTGDTAASVNMYNAQLELGTVPTQRIVTTTAPVTRSATITSTDISLTKLTGASGAGSFVYNKYTDGSSKFVLGSFVASANKFVFFDAGGTGVGILAYKTGETTLSRYDNRNVSTIGIPYKVDWSYKQGGVMKIRAYPISTSPPVFLESGALTFPVQLGATLETGSNGLGSSQYPANFIDVRTWSSHSQAEVNNWGN